MIDTATRFESHRGHLWMVAHRMLGSPSEADDAVQQAWLHLTRAGTKDVENLGGWLTTIVVRVCLDMLRSKKARREAPLADQEPSATSANPEHAALVADSITLGLRLVLQTLSPAERVALIFHEMFDLSFDELAPMVCRSATAARKLASRARQRVQHAQADKLARAAHHRDVIDAFRAASRDGDLTAVLELLCPEAIRHTRAMTATAGDAMELRPEIGGAVAVVDHLSSDAETPQPALVDGTPGAIWASPDGGPARAVVTFAIEGGRVVDIKVVDDPAQIRAVELVLGE